MKNVINKIAIAAAITLSAGMLTSANANPQLDALLDDVKKNRISEAKLNKQREAEFLSARADKQALLKKAQNDLKNETARGERLKKQYNDNEITLANKETELQNAVGTLGEMFGVVRGTAADALGRISTSVVSAQYPGRSEVLEPIANASKGLPELKQLEELWIALQTEMTQSAKVVKFDAQVTNLDGSTETRQVTRIGNFNLVDGDKYLTYSADNALIQPLGRQPDGYIVGLIPNFNTTTTGYAPLFLDVSQGTILGLLTQKKTLAEHYHNGGNVGYAITALLLLGLLIAAERLITLGLISAKIKTQLKNTAAPSDKNPLGRILKVYQDNKHADVENLELKLDEAILRETPRIERGVSIIKIMAAIAPLMGLLGTVIGMIGTFQSITLFGTGDPRIMAGNISLALVTTALGLIAALPLIFVHSIVAARSKSLVHVLDEQSAGIVAAHAEKE